MDFAWFIYTIALMAVLVAAASTALMVWVLTSRRDLLPAAVGFLLYLLDVGVILYDEYVRAKPAGDAYFFVGLTHPVFQAVINAGLLTSLWMWAGLRVGEEAHTRTKMLCVGAVLGASLLLMPSSVGTTPQRTLAYWGFRDMMAALAFAWIVWRSAVATTLSEQADLVRLRRPVIVCLVLVAAMIVEDVANILFVRPDYSVPWVADLYWHLTERNLSENLLMLWLAYLLVRSARTTMRVFARHPVHDEAALGKGVLRPDFEVRLLKFADEHGLSRREREVLALVLKGRDTRNVASELVISVGTVKAHLHRIYQKANVGGREELTERFWCG